MAIELTQLNDAFSDSVGKKQAEEIVETAAKSSGHGVRNEYSEDEAMDVVNEISDLDDVDNFVAISANTVKTRIRTGSM